ncbi:hypothetical protein F4777DRAFT_545357 [Nemania sp. FL0916]|nr:hypothetical protein F4777DRAFT_545357 [Nemania sp. FL0916]
MSVPLRLPSKAVARTVRGIALGTGLGTTCAIGVIIEERRRRISTLQTIVANKQKLKSSRQYNQSSIEQIGWQPGDDAILGCLLPWYEKESQERGEFAGVGIATVYTASGTAASGRISRTQDLSWEATHPKSDEIPIRSISQPSPSESILSRGGGPIAIDRRIPLIPPISPIQLNHSRPMIRDVGTGQTRPDAATQPSHNDPVLSITNLLANIDREKLDLAVSIFLTNSSAIHSGPQIDEWLQISARMISECRARDRWEDAGRILDAVLKSGPLREAHYFVLDPVPIIEYYLRQSDDAPSPMKSINAAARIFLAQLTNREHGAGSHMVRLGKILMSKLLSSHRSNATRSIYWRIMGWAENPVETVTWAIDTYFQHKDYKNLVRVFLVHHSYLASSEHFMQAMDYVSEAVEATKASHASSILETFARMECPENTKLRARWVMLVLRVYWNSHKDLSKTIEMFDSAVSLGLLEKVNRPEAVYRAMVEIVVKADDAKLASTYAERVMRDYPGTKYDISLKLVPLKAQAGEWDDVFRTFKQAHPSKLAKPASYNDAFIPALMVFAESHSASETREFAMRFIRETELEFHPHLVTIVAKKYGEARDMEGFVEWLQLCSEHGFALDTGFSNSVLHNCSAAWKDSFIESKMLYTKLQALNPKGSDNVTQRILSQAAHRECKAFNRFRPKGITVSKLAYSGRSREARDIYEAMNQELMSGRPKSAVIIYKKALNYGMPFNTHCLRLAVLASLRGDGGSSSALAMIQSAHARGHEVGHAISIFIRHHMETFFGSPEDLMIRMQNMINRFESLGMPIHPDVLIHMGTVCTKIGQHQKAIVLCSLARDKNGALDPYFSRDSLKTLTTAYSQLLDTESLGSLLRSMHASEFSADKAVLLHLKSLRRRVRKMDTGGATAAWQAMLATLDGGIHSMTQARAEARQQSNVISEEALRLVGDAAAEQQHKDGQMQSRNTAQDEIIATTTISTEGPHERRERDPIAAAM